MDQASCNHREPDYRRPALTAIIPAYNESGRIEKVVAVVLQAQCVYEVIVVDDGSTDGMAAQVLQFGQGDPRLKVIRHAANRGKGQAIVTGWKASLSSVVLILDADLIHLTSQHVQALAQPVLSGEADMAIGLFQHGPFLTDFSHWLTPWLSGQRCLRAELIGRLPDRAVLGYGFETCLSTFARREKWRVKHVAWNGVSHHLGILLRSGWSGLQRKAKMYRDIIRTWLFIEFGWPPSDLHQYKIHRHH